MDLMTLLVGDPDDFMPDGEAPPSYDDGPDANPQPPPSEWVCEVCGRDVPKRRGRRPKHILCEDDQLRTADTTPKSSREPVKRLSKEAKDEHRLKKISGDLQEGLGKLTGTIVPFMPVTGTTVALKGPNACDAVVQAAAPFPRFLDGLEKAAMALPWIVIAEFLAAITLAVAVDTGRLEPYGIAAEMLGVADAAAKAGYSRNAPQSNVVSESRTVPSQAEVHGFTAPQPPRFSMNVN